MSDTPARCGLTDNDGGTCGKPAAMAYMVDVHEGADAIQTGDSPRRLVLLLCADHCRFGPAPELAVSAAPAERPSWCPTCELHIVDRCVYTDKATGWLCCVTCSTALTTAPVARPDEEETAQCEAVLVSERGKYLFECTRRDGHEGPHADRRTRWFTSPPEYPAAEQPLYGLPDPERPNRFIAPDDPVPPAAPVGEDQP